MGRLSQNINMTKKSEKNKHRTVNLPLFSDDDLYPAFGPMSAGIVSSALRPEKKDKRFG